MSSFHFPEGPDRGIDSEEYYAGSDDSELHTLEKRVAACLADGNLTDEFAMKVAKLMRVNRMEMKVAIECAMHTS